VYEENTTSLDLFGPSNNVKKYCLKINPTGDSAD
jgi:hypothetical protein